MEVQVQERIVEVPHIQTIEKVVEARLGRELREPARLDDFKGNTRMNLGTL